MKVSLVISFCLHGFLLLFLITIYSGPNFKHHYENKINVYISRNYYQNSPDLNKDLASHQRKGKNSSNQKKLNKNSIYFIKTNFNNRPEQKLQLISILHNLIQEQIIYPINFTARGNKELYISFILFPEGRIENIKILKSSGVEFLDHMAVDAIASLGKLEVVKKLLNRSEKFNVPIKFLF